MITLSLWPRRFGNSQTWTKPFVQWPTGGPWTSLLVPVSTRMIFEWPFGYHVMFPLLCDTLQNPVCISILPSHHHAHYTIAPVTGFVPISRWRVLASPWHSHLYLARRWWMSSHREGPKNISPSSEEQIPLLSCPITCQTFRCAWKLSLWSSCYKWHLSNPKAHRLVGSDRDTLMVWGTKTHTNTSCYNKWFQTI
jgi:hypothetical protein